MKLIKKEEVVTYVIEITDDERQLLHIGIGLFMKNVNGTTEEVALKLYDELDNL